MKLSNARWSFGSRPTVAIRKPSSAVMLRKYSVWRTASSIWRGKLCLSVWFTFENQRLCLRVQPLFFKSNRYYVSNSLISSKGSLAVSILIPSFNISAFLYPVPVNSYISLLLSHCFTQPHKIS